MKRVPLAFLVAASLSIVSVGYSQGDKDADDALKQASEAAAKMGVKVPDVKKQMAEIAEQEAQEKAALQKQVDAPGPVALPDWTPKTPQLTTTTPARKKIVDDQVDIVLEGTSTLTPAELGDIWEKAKGDKLNSSRNNISVNNTKTVVLFLSTREGEHQEVKMEATRAPEEKITHVTISSLLPKPDDEDADDD